MKLLTCILSFCLFSSPAWSWDAVTIGTGGPNSPSYQLIKEVAPLWRTSKAELGLTLTSSVQPSFERAKKELLANRLNLAVLPLKMVTSNELKVLALLWEVNLIPFGLSVSPEEISPTDETIYIDNGDGVFRSIKSKSFVPLDSPLFHQQLRAGVSGLYLKEIPGSFTSLRRFAGQTLHPTSLSSGLAQQLIHNHPWLESRSYRFRQAHQTVGYTLVLVGTDQIDLELANQLYLFLKSPPKLLWGKGRWLRSLLTKKTERLNQSRLHPAIYYIKPN